MNKLSLSTKLITIFSTALLSLCAVSLYVHKSDRDALNKLYASANSSTSEITQVRDIGNFQRTLLKTSITLRNIILSNEPRERDHYVSTRDTLSKELGENLHKLRKSSSTRQIDLYNQIDTQVQKFIELVVQYDKIRLADGGIPLKQETVFQLHDLIELEIVPIRNRIASIVDAISQLDVDQVSIQNDRSNDLYQSVQKEGELLMWILPITSLVILLAVYMVIRRTTKAIELQISTFLEIGSTVRSRSENLHETSKILLSRAQSSVKSLYTSTRALEKLTEQANETARQGDACAHHTARMKDIAETGKKDVTELVNSVARVAESSRKIADLTKVIDEIAFQTNLLALNAAVEAARAGESGKGFAVVAEEVRSLALRSGDSAKNISEVIKHSNVLVGGCLSLANRGGEIFEEIYRAVEEITDMNKKMKDSAIKQEASVLEIEDALEQVSETTQENLDTSEETAHASISLLSEAEQISHRASELSSLVTAT